MGSIDASQEFLFHELFSELFQASDYHWSKISGTVIYFLTSNILALKPLKSVIFGVMTKKFC